MAEAGWMNDPSDPRLARWFDGVSWTEHTLVKAEWQGPGAPPPPTSEDRTLAFEAQPVAPAPPPPPPPPPITSHLPPPPPVIPVSSGSGTGSFAPPTRSSSPSVGDRYRGLPKWARIAVPSTAAFLLLGAIASAGDDPGDAVRTDGDRTTTTVTEEDVVDLDEAVAIAQSSLAPGVQDGDVRAVILGICDADADSAAAAAVNGTDSPGSASSLISAAAEGAAGYCPPEDTEERRDVIVGVAVATDLLWSRAPTATTPTPEVTAPPVATTAPSTRATSPPATSPRVTSPPATSPPQTSPPATQPPSGGGCTPGYSPCLQQGIGDWDCAGGSGDGPNYVNGPVQVTGSDPYDLDRGGEPGVGCES